MKKASLFFFAVIAYLSASAQDKPIIALDAEAGPTARFGIKNMHADTCIQRLIRFLGTPSEKKPGYISWDNVSIKGLPDKVAIALDDAIRSIHKGTKTEYWIPYKSEADKQKKLTKLGPNEQRDIAIRIEGYGGIPVITSKEQELAAKDFLNKAFEKK